jgi:hypothetical protein
MRSGSRERATRPQTTDHMKDTELPVITREGLMTHNHDAFGILFITVVANHGFDGAHGKCRDRELVNANGRILQETRPGRYFLVRVIDQQGNVAIGNLFVGPSFRKPCRSQGPNRRRCGDHLDEGSLLDAKLGAKRAHLGKEFAGKVVVSERPRASPTQATRGFLNADGNAHCERRIVRNHRPDGWASLHLVGQTSRRRTWRFISARKSVFQRPRRE